MNKVIITAALMLLIGTTAFAAPAADTAEIGSPRETVHEFMGKGTESSAGLKEIYDLGDAEAILHYDNDVLVRGFIIR